MERNDYREVQLCWDCQNAYAHLCKKFQGGVVNGWKIKKVVMNEHGNNIEVIHVLECPNFIRDKKVNYKNKDILHDEYCKYDGLVKMLKVYDGRARINRD